MARRNFTTRKRALVAIVIVSLGILGWIGFTRVRSLMMLGNVDSAIGRVRTIVAAENQFAQFHPGVGYTCVLSQLPQDDQLERLAKDGMDNGFAFSLVGCEAKAPKKPITVYHVIARPLRSSLPAFCSDQSGVLRIDEAGSVHNCLANGVPLS